MTVAKLLISHINLKDVEFEVGSYFNPIQDAHGNWIVSLEESKHLNQSDFKLIEYYPIQNSDFSVNS